MPDQSSGARAVLETELQAWQQHVGRSQMQRVSVDAEVLRRFAVATGANADIERSLPPLAHWALFLDAVAAEQIGEDGHPLRGGFLPAVHLARRMFAAGRVEFLNDLHVGATADCTTTITGVNHKRGQAGDLVFVELLREVTQAGAPVLQERQTLVYRGPSAPLDPIENIHAPPSTAQRWCPGPVDLFRFSAVTFNSHRIHYDQHYARSGEGYPDLVVHGPFTAVKLLALASAGGVRAVRSFEFRVAAPLFVSQPIYLAPAAAPGSFAATRCDGVVAATAKVEFQ